MQRNEENSQASFVGGQDAKRSGPLRAFSYVGFRLFWFASLASVISFFMSTIARGWLVLDITDSPFLVTAINAAGMAPTLVFSLYGGVMADRMNRRLLMIVSDTFSLIMVSILAILILFNLIQLWQIFLLTLIHGTAFAIGMPARAALISNLVSGRDMASAVALFTIVFSAGQMVGPGMAGYLINSYGMASPFVSATIILIIGIGFLIKLQIPVTGNETQNENVGFDDVDGGKTTLFSPVFDLSEFGEAIITYEKWYSNNVGDNPDTDYFEFQVSNDGGDSWVYIENSNITNNEWIENQYLLSNYISLSNEVQFKFIASDEYFDGDNGSGGSIIEAAIDDFNIFVFEGSSCNNEIGDPNGDGVINVLDIVLMISYILETGTLPEICSADLNGDGLVNVLDIVLVVNMILG